MSTRKIEMHRLQELVRLHRMAEGKREVARLLNMSPNTERTYRNILESAGLLEGDPENLPPLEELKTIIMRDKPPKEPSHWKSTVDMWAEEILRMVEKGAKPKAIYDFLRLQKEDFHGSLSAIKRKYKQVQRDKGISEDDVVIPVETKPGEVAQVDFGYAGKIFDRETNVVRKAWFFTMVLCYSRHMYADMVFDQKVETWIRLHMEAFRYFGGVVEVVIPDNLKSAVVRAAFGVDEPSELNRSYRELARYYRFKVDPTPPRQPKKKGKVESSVKYIKRNFLKPRDLDDIGQARTELFQWIQKIAGPRIHGTTGKRPIEVFEGEEMASLRGLPPKPYEVIVWKKAKVHRDSHIEFNRRLYSVPWQYIDKEVWVQATPFCIYIYQDDKRIAMHERKGIGYRSTQDEHLPGHRVNWRYRSRLYWEERAGTMGEGVRTYIKEVFDSDDVLLKLRTVQSIVTYLETYPRERACAACLRASYWGNYTYKGLKGILRKALDLEPLPTFDDKATSELPKPLYARSVDELFNLKENDYASN